MAFLVTVSLDVIPISNADWVKLGTDHGPSGHAAGLMGLKLALGRVEDDMKKTDAKKHQWCDRYSSEPKERDAFVERSDFLNADIFPSYKNTTVVDTARWTSKTPLTESWIIVGHRHIVVGGIVDGAAGFAVMKADVRIGDKTYALEGQVCARGDLLKS